jgi:hypothetical protein
MQWTWIWLCGTTGPDVIWVRETEAERMLGELIGKILFQFLVTQELLIL